MNMKKVLAISIVLIAIFSSLSVASAGWFDFITGPQEVANQTYKFDEGFTLDIPENANVTNFTLGDSDYLVNSYYIDWETANGTNQSVMVVVMSGNQLVDSVDEYIANTAEKGGVSEGTHGQWAIINMANYQNNGVMGSGYRVAFHTGDYLISLEGDDLALLESIADSYKPA